MANMRQAQPPEKPGRYLFHDGVSAYEVDVFERNGELWQADAGTGRDAEPIRKCRDGVCSWSDEPIEDRATT